MEKKRQWVIVVVVGLVGLFLGILCGALGGGAIGYVLGRRTDGGLAWPWQQYPRATPSFPEKQPTPGQTVPLRPGTQSPLVQGGALVVEVLPDTPAQRAGLQAGDIIIAVDGERVGSQQRLSRLIGQHKPGDRVMLTVVRSRGELRVDVALMAHPENATQGYLGVRVRDLDLLQP